MIRPTDQTGVPDEVSLLRTPERWATRIGLVLAMAGNAIGLGNFIRFPAQAAANGGGAFLIPYLISFVLMGIPLLWVEWAIGRYGGMYGHHSAPGMLDKMGPYRWLKYVGVFGIFTNLGIAAYYCYVESWTLAYAWHSFIGTFQGATAATNQPIPPATFFQMYRGEHEQSLFALPREALAFFLVTLVINVYILSKGVSKGIETTAKIGMPLLFLFAIVLVVMGLSLQPGHGGVKESPWVGLNFIWQPDLSGLRNPTIWLAAAGQIFFTLSVGIGCVQAYASYVGRNQDIALNASSAGWLNEFAEVILGGSLIIPIATAYLGLEAVRASTGGGSGFALGFFTLPQLFNNWGWFAPVAGIMWFGLLFIAALTSSLAMGQPVLAFFHDEFRVARHNAALIFGAVILALGFFCVWLLPGGAFDEFDFWTGTFALVVFALAEIFIFGWVFGIRRGWAEITRGADMRVPGLFRYVIGYVTPIFILVVFVGAMIKPEASWGQAYYSLVSGNGWPFAADSVVGMLMHKGAAGGYHWFNPQTHYATKDLVKDVTRMLLLAVFLACGVLVWVAWRRKRRAPK
jgi:NSS family neurotransmitter:Na+ symporter